MPAFAGMTKRQDRPVCVLYRDRRRWSCCSKLDVLSFAASISDHSARASQQRCGSPRQSRARRQALLPQRRQSSSRRAARSRSVLVLAVVVIFFIRPFLRHTGESPYPVENKSAMSGVCSAPGRAFRLGHRDKAKGRSANTSRSKWPKAGRANIQVVSLLQAGPRSGSGRSPGAARVLRCEGSAQAPPPRPAITNASRSDPSADGVGGKNKGKLEGGDRLAISSCLLISGSKVRVLVHPRTFSRRKDPRAPLRLH